MAIISIEKQEKHTDPLINPQNSTFSMENNLKSYRTANAIKRSVSKTLKWVIELWQPAGQPDIILNFSTPVYNTNG